jgi:hypothetical protein
MQTQEGSHLILRTSMRSGLFETCPSIAGFQSRRCAHIRQLADLRCNVGCNPRTARAQVCLGPHEVVGGGHPASLKGIQERHGPAFREERCSCIHLDHGSRGRAAAMAFVCVCFLFNPHRGQLRLEGASINYSGTPRPSLMICLIVLPLLRQVRPSKCFGRQIMTRNAVRAPGPRSTGG